MTSVGGETGVENGGMIDLARRLGFNTRSGADSEMRLEKSFKARALA
jgi:hypothetical protein